MNVRPATLRERDVVRLARERKEAGKCLQKEEKARQVSRFVFCIFFFIILDE